MGDGKDLGKQGRRGLGRAIHWMLRIPYKGQAGAGRSGNRALMAGGGCGKGGAPALALLLLA